MVWVNLTWKQKTLAQKTAQSHLRRDRCNRFLSTLHSCGAANRESTNGLSNKTHMRGRSRLPPETECVQGTLLRWRPEQTPGTQMRANTVTGETDISPPVTQPLLPPLNHLPVHWLWLTAAPRDEEAVLEGIPPKKS